MIKSKSGCMESLPSDALLNILCRVPAESVLECKLVSKKWATLINDSGNYFTLMHLSHLIKHWYISDQVPSLFFACQREDLESPTLLYHGRQVNTNEKYSYKQNLKKINHPPIRNKIFDHLVGSCNGLICAYICHHRVIDPIYIFNPITREYVYLPALVEADPPTSCRACCDRVEKELNLTDISCGFGYARSTNEYKVVRIYHRPTTRKGRVQVYTLGSGSGWRDKCTIPYGFITHYGGGAFANGAIYWIGGKNLVAFDLADEEFRLLPFPPCMSNCNRNRNSHGLAALGGKLCFYFGKSSLEIWSLDEKKCSDPKEIWSLDFDIDFQDVDVECKWKWFKPILLTQDEQVILVYNDDALYCYDPKTTALKMISDEDEVSTKYFSNVEAIPHVNTLVSLEAMGEKSKRYLVGDHTWEGNEFEQLEGADLV